MCDRCRVCPHAGEPIRRAVELVRAGIIGKAVTPSLLDRLAHLSGGRTLTANMALLEANARLAGEIAVCLSNEVNT